MISQYKPYENYILLSDEKCSGYFEQGILHL